MGSDEHPPASGGPDADGPIDEPGPPPAPMPPSSSAWAQGPDRASVQRPRRGPRILRALLAVLLLGSGFVAGLAAAERTALPSPFRDGTAEVAAEEVLLEGLLTDVAASEGVMLRFNDAVEATLDDAQDPAQDDEESEVLRAIALAAAEGVGGLGALRPAIDAREGDERLVAVRVAYLPHLDSWIDYLDALAQDPALLFTVEAQQPFLLRINATAETFGDALEALIATEPSPAVVELAERILDEGFRSEGPEPSI